MRKNVDIIKDLSIPLTSTSVEWNLYIYKKKYKNKSLTNYEVYKIDDISIGSLYSDINNHVLKNYIEKMEIHDYSPEMPKNTIGFIDLKDNNNVLKSSLELLNGCIDNYTQFNSQKLSLDGYIIECNISGKTFLKILCNANPIKHFKHKYLITNGFAELSDPILSLNSYCDCIIFNDYTLFFTGKAENIFDLEKHYKVIASQSLTYLESTGIIENFEDFKNYSSVWPKAAKFEGFDIERMKNFLKLDIPIRAQELNKFFIPVNQNGIIVANSPEEREKVLNFICGKLLTDFNNDGYEVAYPKKIDHQ